MKRLSITLLSVAAVCIYAQKADKPKEVQNIASSVAAEKKVVTPEEKSAQKSTKTWGSVTEFAPRRSGNAVEELKEITKEGIVIVDFWQDMCPPCKYIAPFIQEFAKQYPHERYIKVNVGEYRAFTKAFGIRGVPRVDVYVDGKLKGSVGGGREKTNLRAAIERLIAKA